MHVKLGTGQQIWARGFQSDYTVHRGELSTYRGGDAARLTGSAAYYAQTQRGLLWNADLLNEVSFAEKKRTELQPPPSMPSQERVRPHTPIPASFERFSPPTS
jgi:hypothetical protein